SAPRLDLGKKVSTPQDVMIEELSLRTNRGSQLFQQRQRRMQRFIFEYPSGYRKVGLLGSPGTLAMGTGLFPSFYSDSAEGQQRYHSELHVAASARGGPPEVPKKTEKVLHMSKVLNPDALAPGYSGPLKEVPPEKFNATAIPKGYRSPWQELLNEKHYPAESANHLLMKASHGDFRNFNRTPTPFDRAQVSDTFSLPVMEFDNLSTLELMSRRPSFNRAPQGWVRILPESEEL
ncbi:MYOZ3 protein, partial [Nothoprocta ornata]|nr:MYOZ3 protein [Nothoprocta pentlandii]NWX95333.1 MYOZ3 protein [Nothoprocta ornata]